MHTAAGHPKPARSCSQRRASAKSGPKRRATAARGGESAQTGWVKAARAGESKPSAAPQHSREQTRSDQWARSRCQRIASEPARRCSTDGSPDQKGEGQGKWTSSQKEGGQPSRPTRPARRAKWHMEVRARQPGAYCWPTCSNEGNSPRDTPGPSNGAYTRGFGHGISSKAQVQFSLQAQVALAHRTRAVQPGA